MTEREKVQIDAQLKVERNAEIAEALEILGAGEKESLKDAVTRRMWQAMPDLMKQRNPTGVATR